jgi:hypothetical protein
MKKIKIDRAVYLVDTKTRTYKYLSKNPNWKNLTKQENIRNKRSILGFTRILKNRRRKIYTYE